MQILGNLWNGVKALWAGSKPTITCRRELFFFELLDELYVQLSELINYCYNSAGNAGYIGILEFGFSIFGTGIGVV